MARLRGAARPAAGGAAASWTWIGQRREAIDRRATRAATPTCPRPRPSRSWRPTASRCPKVAAVDGGGDLAAAAEDGRLPLRAQGRLGRRGPQVGRRRRRAGHRRRGRRWSDAFEAMAERFDGMEASYVLHGAEAGRAARSIVGVDRVARAGQPGHVRPRRHLRRGDEGRGLRRGAAEPARGAGDDARDQGLPGARGHARRARASTWRASRICCSGSPGWRPTFPTSSRWTSTRSSPTRTARRRWTCG